MHELSIAHSIVGIVQDNVPAQEQEKVTRVRVRVGRSSGVVPDSLVFAFEALVSGTPLSGALLVIEEIPFSLHCRTCNQDSINTAGFALCMNCGSSETEIISGTELSVADIEIADMLEADYEHSYNRA
jgi:hydrogenase nickel incorporation protein HypA/HybF